MAGNNDRQWVFAVSQTNRSRRGAPTDRQRQLPIAPCVAVRNVQELLPHAFLKCCSADMKRQLKCGPLTLEVFGQLTFGFTEDGMMELFMHVAQFDASRSVVWPENCHETRFVCDQLESAHRRVHVRVRQHIVSSFPG